LDKSNREINAAHPKQGFEGIHGHEAVHGQVDWDQCHGYPGEPLRKSATSQAPCDQHRERNQERTCDRWKHPQYWQTAAQQQSDSREKSNQRSMVHIPPTQVPATIEVIQFVPEVSVTGAQGKVEQQLDSTQQRS
jgi:hypothetical protein